MQMLGKVGKRIVLIFHDTRVAAFGLGLMSGWIKNKLYPR